MFERTQKENENSNSEKESRIQRIIDRFENCGAQMDIDRKKPLERKYNIKAIEKETYNKENEKKTLTLEKKVKMKSGSMTRDMTKGAEKKEGGIRERISLMERKPRNTVERDGSDESINSTWREKD